MRCFARRALVLWQLVCLQPVSASFARADTPLMYGGIEVGAKGIKVVAVPIDENGAPDLRKKVQNLKHVAVNNVTLADLDDHGNFKPDAIAEASAAIADFHRQLSGDYKIPPERLWIVASSGLAAKGLLPANMDELRKAVMKATGGEESLEEISQVREVELLVRGVIPRASWGDSIVLDVGSGNSKVGYIEPKIGINIEKVEVLRAEIEGTVRFTRSINDEMKKQRLKGFTAFRDLAARSRDQIEERIQADLSRKAGLKARPRVYISGGAVWAIATLTNPGQVINEELYINFPLKVLREFHEQLRTTGKLPTPNLAALAPQDRERAEQEIRSVRDLFTAENLLAGSEILLGFAQVLDWQESDKELYFAKSGVVAWIVGYVESERKKLR
jgi:hypothetical protein